MDVEGNERIGDERALFAPREDSSRTAPLPAILPAGRDVAPSPHAGIAGRAARHLRGMSAAIGPSIVLELERGAAFLLVPVLICAGAAIYFTLDAEPGWMAIGSVGLLLASIAWLGRGREALRHGAVALLLIVAGIGAGKLETWRADTRIIGGEITTRLTGRIETIEQRESGRVRLTLTVLATERPALRYQPERVRVTARAIPLGAMPGSVLTGLVRLSQPLGPLRPGSYDFAFDAYFDGIGATGFFLGNPVAAEAGGAAPWTVRLSAWIEGRRLALAERIRGAIGGAEGEIAAALVAGVRAGIPEEVNETLRITGLAHVLSISGLHMALVAGVVIGSLRLAFAAFPSFASRYPVRKYAAGGALAALAAYLLISGSQVAAERAFVMIAVMLTALLFDRAALTMRNLAIAALAIVLVSPHEVVGPSFQMSFAATAALVAAYAWWAERRAGQARGVPANRTRTAWAAQTAIRYVLALAATSLIAGAATGIFGAWHFQRVSPLGLAANLAAMPIFSVIVMPAAVAGMALMPFGLDGYAFGLMGEGLSAALAVAGWLAERTPVDAIGAIPSFAVVCLALALVPLTLASTATMRALAIPILALGVAALFTRDLPLVLVSEEGRLVGVRTGDRMLAVNRARPHAFTTEDWQRATMTTGVVKPAEKAGEGLGEKIGADRFVCDDALCLIDAGSGRIVAHAQTMPAAQGACAVAAVIVIADPSAANPCPGSGAVIVTGRHLALRGSAEISFAGDGRAVVTHAIAEEGARPWHDHRRFSRAARGLAPYAPKKEEAGAKPAS